MQEADYKAAPVVKLESLSDVNDIGKPWRYEETGSPSRARARGRLPAAIRWAAASSCT